MLKLKHLESGPYVEVALLLVAGLLACAGLFDRVAQFNDEVIALYGTIDGKFFTYALRPLYYFLNSVSVAVFGSSLHSLVFSSALAYVMIAFLIYKTLADIGCRTAGLLAFAVFLLSDLTFGLGIRAMPHIYVSLFSLLTIYCLVRAWFGAQPRSLWGGLAGCLAIATLAVHPTAIGITAAFFGVVGLHAMIRLYLAYPQLRNAKLALLDWDIYFLLGGFAAFIMTVLMFKLCCI